MRLLHLVAAWPDATGAEIVAVVERSVAEPSTPVGRALRGMYLGLER